ncbi:MAG TPA: VapC toxin family PIN domain ribonuclease, partial [Anaerolineae bacterium]|nr:VapC toxin family PIN domain ribonuclease [Anaerolineae bacterium]
MDSDVMIDLLRQYPPAVQWFGALPDNEALMLPGYVMMELIQGCKNKVELTNLRYALADYGIVWLSPDQCDAALTVFSEYRLSHNAGLLDTLIG